MIRLITAILLLVLASISNAIQPDPVYRETEIRNDRPRAAGEVFDPQEANPELRDVFSTADKLAERRVGNVERNADFIHKFWHEKKSILHEKYDIQWLSPADLNPTIDYGDYGQPPITDNERESITQYLVAEKYMRHEIVLRIWRIFEGEVYVETEDKISSHIRHYKLAGIADRWRLIDVHFVAY